MTKILILGGTEEAAQLAAGLVANGHDVITSLAGRTKEPKPLEGSVRIGGFGGVKGLVKYLREERIDRLIDATHPFAKQISANARLAATQSGIPFEIKTRMPWKKQPGDAWIEVESLEEARAAIPSNARVFLTLGSQHIDLFKSREDVFFLVRMVDPPEEVLPLAHHELLIGMPSTDWREELNVLQTHELTHIVCRNSGGTGAYAKIEAARACGLPVIIVQSRSNSCFDCFGKTRTRK